MNMALIEAGRVCVKLAGRGAGTKVVVLGVEGKTATVEGVREKKGKVNVKHLYPTAEKAHVSKNISKEEIAKILKG